jgi:uncharacterized membrane protein YbhN (UPF0104 family)
MTETRRGRARACEPSTSTVDYSRIGTAAGSGPALQESLEMAAAVPKPRSRTRVSLLQLSVTLVALALLLSRLDLGGLGRSLSSAGLVWVAAAIGLSLVDRALMIGKWIPLLWVHVPDVPIVQAARAYLAAGFTNYLMPSTLGSDTLRAAALGRPRGRIFEVAASIAAERLFGMIGNGAVAALALLVALHMALPVDVAGAIAVGLLAAGVLTAMLPFSAPVRRLAGRLWKKGRWSAPREALRRLVHAYVDYARYPGRLVVVGALTLIEVFFPLAVHMAFARALGLEVPVGALLVAVSFSGLIARLPVSIAGLGVQELTLTSVLAGLGVATDQAAALALGCRLVDVAVAVPGAFILADLLPGLRRAELAAAAPAPAVD